MRVSKNPIVKLLAKIRMAWADARGHHGKVWDYEPGEYYMGRHADTVNTRRDTRSDDQSDVDYLRCLHINLHIRLRHSDIEWARSQTDTG